VGFEPTTPGLKVRDPSDELGPTTCLKSRRPPFGSPRLACVVTSNARWSGRRESNPRQPAWKAGVLLAGDPWGQVPRIVNQDVLVSQRSCRRHATTSWLAQVPPRVNPYRYGWSFAAPQPRIVNQGVMARAILQTIPDSHVASPASSVRQPHRYGWGFAAPQLAIPGVRAFELGGA
jgi:hypothetical protein